LQFHILSFEGPDAFSRVGGLATRVNGLAQALTDLEHEVHFWFVGDPDLPSHEKKGLLALHRWCQPISQIHREHGLYAGEHEKSFEFATSLPIFLLESTLLPHLLRGGEAVILAEEWQTTNAVLHLDWLLQRMKLRDQVTIFWTANNVFGFETINWESLVRAARIATVSRYMKDQLQHLGVDAVVIPNGLSPDNYIPPDSRGTTVLRRRFRERTVIAKLARWDPDKRWLASLDIVAALKRHQMKPLMIARGGTEPHGWEVLAYAKSLGLRIQERQNAGGSLEGTLDALRDFDDVDLILLHSQIDADARRALFRAADVVLANSVREPFGLVGLETMAVGGIACTGCTGEDYAINGRNALVLQSSNPYEFMLNYQRLCNNPREMLAMRRAGRATALQYAWPKVIERSFVPQLEMARLQSFWKPH
jgi:glycosyltransferase involved in cell wall biosynthesis